MLAGKMESKSNKEKKSKDSSSVIDKEMLGSLKEITDRMIPFLPQLIAASQFEEISKEKEGLEEELQALKREYALLNKAHARISVENQQQHDTWEQEIKQARAELDHKEANAQEKMSKLTRSQKNDIDSRTAKHNEAVQKLKKQLEASENNFKQQSLQLDHLNIQNAGLRTINDEQKSELMEIHEKFGLRKLDIDQL
jgi:chromosome segregation ATPase